LLLDPCLTSPPIIKRQSELPIEIKDLKPDYLLISHGHYDHLDADTIEQFENAECLIPLKMGALIEDMNPALTYQEAGWYQEYNLDEAFKVTFLPAQHWYRRSAFDTNTVLWGSFMIETGEQTLYFSGDTAYGEHFKTISNLFGNIDLAILPIGAYAPRWFMHTNHASPEESVDAFKELNAKKFMPMHYGTFDLSDEPMGEPIELLKAAMLNTTNEQDRLAIVDIGEIYALS